MRDSAKAAPSVCTTGVIRTACSRAASARFLGTLCGALRTRFAPECATRGARRRCECCWPVVARPPLSHAAERSPTTCPTHVRGGRRARQRSQKTARGVSSVRAPTSVRGASWSAWRSGGPRRERPAARARPAREDTVDTVGWSLLRQDSPLATGQPTSDTTTRVDAAPRTW
jgi:hypothetical protein